MQKHVSILTLILFMVPPLAHAAEGETAPSDPSIPHLAPTATPGDAGTSNATAPANESPEAPVSEESSSKGLKVHRAPDFCMKKDPPPHCSE